MVVQMVNNINLNDKEISGKKGKERNLPSEPNEEAGKLEEDGFEVTKVLEPEVVRKSGFSVKNRLRWMQYCGGYKCMKHYQNSLKDALGYLKDQSFINQLQ